MQIPGFVWTAILALIPLLVQWLQGEYFTGQTWVSLAVIILGFLAKLIELYRLQPPRAGLESTLEAEPSKVRRFLLG
jgi:hypothetical protein